MIQAEKFDFRNNKKLCSMIERRFYNGLGRPADCYKNDERVEHSIHECFNLRRDAYCLAFGIKPSDLTNQWIKDYEFLLNLSKIRA